MNQLTVSSSPHIRTKDNVSRIMLDVVIALIPAGLVSAYYYGGRVLTVIIISILTAIITEVLIQKLMKKPVTIKDFSAVVTGLLLAYNLPPTAPLWLPAIGSIIAIALVKQAFGGLGHNFMNPALAARAILLAAWPGRMTNFVEPGSDLVSSATVDALAYATPLDILKGGEASASDLPSILDAFLGNIGGSIGEISTIALLLGAAYLLIRRVIDWKIPVIFIGTVFVLVWLLGGQDLYESIYHLLSGGLILGAFFMATDYSSSPVTSKGRIIMGFGCGFLTAMIRLYGGYPEGVSYAILLMNVATPLIDKFTAPKIYGGGKTE